MYAKVIVEYPVKSLDKMFTYLIPEEMQDKLLVGMKVYVPFGFKNVNGFVMQITNEKEDDLEVKSISAILEPDLVLNDELLKLGFYMQKKTLCTRIMAYQTMLPKAFKAKNQKTNYNYYKTFIILNKSVDDITSYIQNNKGRKKQIEILNKIILEQKVEKKLISGEALNIVIKLDLVKEVKEQQYRINNTLKKVDKVKLNAEQEYAINNIILDKNDTYLLYGVTGSGKTEVYLNLIESVLKMGKTAIMLVPEISLTMQIVKRFYERFSSKVAVLHSALSDGERHDEYLKIIKGEVSVVVGTRSAIFAPLTKLGIIIIDEEHSDTYKQDNYPRYNAIDMADFRCKYHNIPLVLGSATPSLNTMARAQKGVFKLLELKKRALNSTFPKVTLVDMETEFKNKNFVFSNYLVDKIEERLQKGDQIILLLNRRGFSTFITCSNCGFTYKCPNCDISLTYHKTSNNLMCHYCGYQIIKEKICPNCHEDGLNYMGMGTEKLEEEITKKFPLAKIIRMDQDSTTRKGSHDAIIEAFKNEEYNILLGTSMISKGLDFAGVTLVGVINADTSLNMPDYKANENTFSLLNQVAGRAGRREKIGEVIIQTFNPDNKVLKCVKDNSYDEFYKYEMVFRQKLKYPPYYYLVGLKVVSKDYNRAIEEAKKIVIYLKNNLAKETIVLGPTTAAILKYNNLYRFQIIIKYRFDDKINVVLKNLDNIYENIKDTSIEIDFNPTRI